MILILALIIALTGHEKIYIEPTPVTSQEAVMEYRVIGTRSDPHIYTGVVSYYSTEGCLGCPPHYDENGQVYYLTACGDRFTNDASTMAFNRLPCGSTARVTNLDNGQSTIVTVNDTGGFESLGRIADLSKGVYDKLGIKTDVTKVKIEGI